MRDTFLAKSTLALLSLSLWSTTLFAMPPEPGDPSRLMAVGRSSMYGFIDTASGELVLPMRDGLVGSFQEGLAIVQGRRLLPLGHADRLKKGYMDPQERLVIPAIYEDGLSFSEGLAAVNVQGKWGYIDKSGELVIEHQFSDARSFRNGLAWVRNAQRRGSLIDRHGRVILTNRGGSIESNLREGLAVFTKRDKYGFVSETGEIIISARYDSARPFSEGLAAVSENGRYGYINHRGKWVVQPQFEQADDFSEGLAAVSPPGQGLAIWGYINDKGEYAIQPRFHRAQQFKEGLASAYINAKGTSSLGQVGGGNYGFIDKTGDFVIPPVLTDFSWNFENGYVEIFERQLIHTLMDRQGRILWWPKNVNHKPPLPLRNAKIIDSDIK